jgi:DNA processing protein
MQPTEFLSILSTLTPGLNFKHFQSFYQLIDIYDLKKDPTLIFGNVLPEKIAENADWFDDVFREYEFLQKNNIQHLYPNHPFYPKDFYSLEKPPLFLSVLGDLKCLAKNKVSIVGSRYPTTAALEWMSLHLDSIVEEGAVIVSGAARGIDQMAHSVALRNQKPTIAFLPSGLGQIYPMEFSKWKDKIIDYGGLLISEYKYDQLIHGHHFHERNRMIAKLGLFLLVCEARRKSGSTMTARLAIENSKTVCVLPGFPSNKNSQGCLDLLFQGAMPIRDGDDLKILLEAEKTSCLNLIQKNFICSRSIAENKLP